tara:strand:- start:521 stop:790 length:270 start_codon:yes stop_codon:yes gene_type:complete
MARIKHGGMSIAVKRAVENVEADRTRSEAMLVFDFEEPEANPENYENLWEYQLAVQNKLSEINEQYGESFWPEFNRNNDRYMSKARRHM